MGAHDVKPAARQTLQNGVASIKVLQRHHRERCEKGRGTAMRRLILTVVLIVELAAPAGAHFDRAMSVYEPADFALREWRPFAELGDAEAQVGLAALYRHEPGIAKSHDEAEAWYQRADHQGDSWSRFRLDAIEREPPPAKPEVATTEQAGGRFVVQLGAYRRPDRADKAWEQLRAAHPDLLGGLGAAIMHTDLGTEEAAINRLVVGAFETKAAAQELCARLKQRNVDCFVPRP